MPYAEWNDSYSVNIVELDNQHQILLSMLNELYDAMLQKKEDEVLANILDELIGYTTIHFAREEELMKKYFYPGLLVHKKEHESLTAQVVAFRDKHRSGEITVSVKVFDFLVDWLIKHIKDTDRRYSAFLNSHGQK